MGAGSLDIRVSPGVLQPETSRKHHQDSLEPALFDFRFNNSGPLWLFFSKRSGFSRRQSRPSESAHPLINSSCDCAQLVKNCWPQMPLRLVLHRDHQATPVSVTAHTQPLSDIVLSDLCVSRKLLVQDPVTLTQDKVAE